MFEVDGLHWFPQKRGLSLAQVKTCFFSLASCALFPEAASVSSLGRTESSLFYVVPTMTSR